MKPLLVAFFVLQTMAGVAQTASPAPFDQRTAQQISQQAATLLAEAQKSPQGSASVTLEKYPGHLTMLTVRVKNGGAELHKHFNDFFIVVDGEATVVIGGTMTDMKESSPGEFRGMAIEGGERHVMRKGDVVHISPDVPHQTLVAPGKTFTYYVIKVEAPK